MAPHIDYGKGSDPQFVQDKDAKEAVGLFLHSVINSRDSENIPVELRTLLEEFRRRCFMVETPDSVISTVVHFESEEGIFLSMPIYRRAELHYLSLGIKSGQKDIFFRLTTLEDREDNMHAKEIVSKDFIDFYENGEVCLDVNSVPNTDSLREIINSAGLPKGLKFASDLGLSFSEESRYLQDIVSRGFDETFR